MGPNSIPLSLTHRFSTNSSAAFQQTPVPQPLVQPVQPLSRQTTRLDTPKRPTPQLLVQPVQPVQPQTASREKPTRAFPSERARGLRRILGSRAHMRARARVRQKGWTGWTGWARPLFTRACACPTLPQRLDTNHPRLDTTRQDAANSSLSHAVRTHAQARDRRVSYRRRRSATRPSGRRASRNARALHRAAAADSTTCA